MGVLNRLFKVGQAQAHSAIDKLENPIKLTEQGIRDLKRDLDKSIKALAEVKAISIQTHREVETHKQRAQSMEAKAIQLIKKAENGDLDVTEADRLATEALSQKEESLVAAATAQQSLVDYQKNITTLEGNIKQLRALVTKYENQARTLKARAKVAQSSKKINKSLSSISSNSTISLLEKMQSKVEENEALAQAYMDVNTEARSLDTEIDNVLQDDKKAVASEALNTLKAKLKKG